MPIQTVDYAMLNRFTIYCHVNNISPSSELRDVIIKSNASGIALDQHKIDHYIKAMSLSGSEKENTEKLAAMWLYATQMGSLPPPSVRKLTPPSRPIVLIPATGSSNAMIPPSRTPHPGIMLPPGMHYHGMAVPYIRPTLYGPHPGSIPGTFRTHKSTKSDINNQRRRRRIGQQIRAGKMDPNRRQRRKSEADVIDGQAFQYHGLDRAIADNFLARQELSNAGSHIDYSSSSAASETYGKQQSKGPSRSSSKTKIVCRDVVM